MEPLYNFVINCSDAELIQYQKMNVEKDAAVFCRWDLEWGLQTYLHLAQRNNLKLKLSNRLENDCVNVVHSAQLMFDGGKPEQFVVCIRADFPARNWAHFHIVQNHNQIGVDTATTLLWVQPGLIGRDQTRTTVKRVAYAGQTFNGNLAGTSHTWASLFAPHNIEFVTLPSGACFDLSDIDVLIGIRSFDTNPHNTKPPSKLINAWHAQIPFIGGFDSAFTQVGEPGEDYIQVKSAQETLDAVLRLKNDPELYRKLVVNGSKKAVNITNDRIAADWEKTLTGPVLDRYKKWQANFASEKIRFITLKGFGAWKHHSKQIIKKVFGSGTIKSLQSKLQKA